MSPLAGEDRLRPTRREFLWTVGAAATTGLALRGAGDVFWSAQADVHGPGWTPGLEETLRSACLLCPARCGLAGRVVDGRLVRLRGNPLHPVSRGGLCPRGVAGVQVLYHPERIQGPMVRDGARGAGAWRRVTREEAIRRIVERLTALRANGTPEAMALVSGSSPGTMDDLWRRFLQAYGSPNLVADDYDDGTTALMGLMHGQARPPGYDFDRSALIVSFGAPLFEAWWSPLQAYVAYGGRANPNGARPRLVQVDTRFSKTAARAHEWVGVRPGTHAVLALGMAYVLIRDELYDAQFVADHVVGFDDYTDAQGRRREGYRSLVLRRYRTEEVSATTGVPVERITTLARAMATQRPALAVPGVDVTHAPHGLLAAMAVHSLNVLTGSVNRGGGVLFGDPPPLAPLAPLVQDAVAQRGVAAQPVGDAAAPFATRADPSRFAEQVVAGSGTRIQALFCYYANPLASSSHPAAWRSAIDRIPFVVSFSPFLDETTRQADLIVPDLLPFERWQDAPSPASYPYPVWALAHPLVEPHPGGTNTGDLILAVAQGLGGSISQSLPYPGYEALLQSRARGLFAARRGTTFGNAFVLRHHREMEERGWWLPEFRGFEAFWNALVARGGWTDLFYDFADPRRVAATPSGRIELLPEALLPVLDDDVRGRRAYVDVADAAAPAAGDLPLRLLPYRESTLASGTLYLERWLAEQPAVFPHVHWVPWVELSPEDAHAFGLADGDTVWVTSARQRYRARLKLSPGTAHGTVCAPYGLRHPDGELANPLQLLDGSRDQLTALPSWISTF
ncbi:MAG: molybdopterin-dependent oxidoreductase, partial [Gemmatimonadales bacterium]